MSVEHTFTSINPENHNITETDYQNLTLLGFQPIIRWAKFSKKYAGIFILLTLVVLGSVFAIAQSEEQIDTLQQGIQFITSDFIFVIVINCIFIGIGFMWIFDALIARKNGEERRPKLFIILHSLMK